VVLELSVMRLAYLFPSDFGYPLWAACVVWAAVVLSLYPASRWFARLKARQQTWWIQYL
jgi:hypothetical protein